MSDINGVSVNSAFFAGRTGLQRASDGIEQAASNIAQTTVRCLFLVRKHFERQPAIHFGFEVVHK